MTMSPNFPSAGGALLATGISNAINRHSIVGNLHPERDPVRKRGAGAARAGYQRAAGNSSPVAAPLTAILRLAKFDDGATSVVKATPRSTPKSTRPTRCLKNAVLVLRVT